MASDPNLPPGGLHSESGPSRPPGLSRPIIAPPPGGLPEPPPVLPHEAAHDVPRMRRILAGLLSTCLALFLADAVLSVVESSLTLVFGVHLLATICGLVALLALLIGLVVYVLMGLTPMIPKRLFLPIALFNPACVLVFIPLLVYLGGWINQVNCLISLCQVAVGLLVLHRVQGRFTWHWPLVAQGRLGSRAFSWPNLFGFLLVNLLVLLPATLAYLGISAALAVHHLTGGFLMLHPNRLTVQVRKYTRHDGKTILLVPMAHIGEADFYQTLSRSFPTNSVVLMEGVSDDRNLITNNISYQRMAAKLGLAEQQKEFKPEAVEIVTADVDVSQFTTNTIGVLNLAMLIHTKGLNARTLPLLLGFSAPPNLQDELLDDLLNKRNQRVLQEIHARLASSRPLIVPWGVAHMPGIAEGITGDGFQVTETREFTVIRFHFPGRRSRGNEPLKAEPRQRN